MKLLFQPHHPRQAFSLIECLTYCALFLVVSSLAMAAYFRMEDQSRGLTRNAGDIATALRAGERWRADLRLATMPPQIDGEVVRIGQKGGDVRYIFRDGAVWRQGPGERQAAVLLERVKSSSMQPDRRQRVTAWRWEVELQARRVEASVRPLFTFIAVPEKEVPR